MVNLSDEFSSALLTCAGSGNSGAGESRGADRRNKHEAIAACSELAPLALLASFTGRRLGFRGMKSVRSPELKESGIGCSALMVGVRALFGGAARRRRGCCWRVFSLTAGGYGVLRLRDSDADA